MFNRLCLFRRVCRLFGGFSARFTDLGANKCMPDRQFIRLHLNLCRQNTFHSANIFLYFFFHQGDVTLRFHCASVQVQVLSGAPLRNDLWMSGSRAGRARLDSKGLSSFKPVTALLGHGFVFIRHEAPPCGAAMMSGIFRFVFLVRRCPICVILHIYHHAVAQYHIENYGKHTADCTQKRICIASS